MSYREKKYVCYILNTSIGPKELLQENLKLT